jgi:hypothetical protein
MRAQSPNEATLKLEFGPTDAGRSDSLKPGALVSIKIVERIGPELYRVAVGPRLLAAASAGLGVGALGPGTILKARVERSGDTILLRLAARDSRESVAAVLSASNQPNDAAARAAVAALLREGIAPDAQALSRVRRAALRQAAAGGERTDLAAKLEAKGIPAEEATIDRLAQACASASSGGDGASTGGRGEGDRKKDGEKEKWRKYEAGTELPEHFLSRMVLEPDLPSVLGDLLRNFAIRTGSGDEARASLALFNHMRGPEGSWVIVPFRFTLGRVDFAGNLRIKLPYVQGGPGRFDARFSASQGDIIHEWLCFLEFGGGREASLRIVPPSGDAGREAWARLNLFSSELASIPCAVKVQSVEAFASETEGLGIAGFDVDA